MELVEVLAPAVVSHLSRCPAPSRWDSVSRLPDAYPARWWEAVKCEKPLILGGEPGWDRTIDLLIKRKLP